MNRIEQLKTLWLACFDDSTVSLDYFFKRAYKEENALCIEEDGRIVSVFHLVPFTMQWCGTEIPVGYVYAACTASEARGKGLMRELLVQSLEVMRERGLLFTLLIPANAGLFAYYRLQGFTEVFDYSVETYTQDALKGIPQTITCQPVDESTANEWYTFFHSCMSKRQMCVVHTVTDFRYLVGNLYINDGMVIGALDEQGKQAGLAFVSINEQEVVQISELLSTSKTVKQQLLQKVMQRFGLQAVECITPPLTPGSERLGMGMVLNRPAMIRLWANYHQVSAEEVKLLEAMDTQELTAHLFDYAHQSASISLMPE